MAVNVLSQVTAFRYFSKTTLVFEAYHFAGFKIFCIPGGQEISTLHTEDFAQWRIWASH